MISYVNKGMFLTLEGCDGSGKTTAVKELANILRNKKYDVVTTREPGGTKVAEEIRSLLLNKREGEQVLPMTELLLFAAARAQHIEAVIKPAMLAGKIIICDRFSDSTFAYQGFGRGYVDDVLDLEQIVHKGFEPDYTLFFDVTLEESIKRINNRVEASNRLDDEGVIFKSRIFDGYQERFKKNPYRMVSIDAMQSIDDVIKQMNTWVDNVLVRRFKQ